MNELVSAWWEQAITTEDKVVRAIDLICVQGLTRQEAAQEAGISVSCFRKYLHKWDIDEWVPSYASRVQADLDEKAQLAIEMLRSGATKKEAMGATGISKNALNERLRNWGLMVTLRKNPPNVARKQQPHDWSVQDAKALLWHGTPEQDVADTLGIPVERLRQEIARNADWCRRKKHCLWCEILLDYAEEHDGETCTDCAQVLRGGPLQARRCC